MKVLKRRMITIQIKNSSAVLKIQLGQRGCMPVFNHLSNCCYMWNAVFPPNYIGANAEMVKGYR